MTEMKTPMNSLTQRAQLSASPLRSGARVALICSTALAITFGCDDQTSPMNPVVPLIQRDASVIGEEEVIERDLALVDVLPSDTGPPLLDQRAPQDATPSEPDVAPPEPDATPPEPDAFIPETPIRVIALGDAGKGNDGQRRVALAIGDFCESIDGCDFALLLGDNIYDSGVDGVDDPQWEDKFRVPYGPLGFPFYATLGNHDYGAPAILQSIAGGIGVDRSRGLAQVEYAGTQDQFRMPDTHYRFVEGPAEFISLNTTSVFWQDLYQIGGILIDIFEGLTGFAEESERQEISLEQWFQARPQPWRIAFSHHPYISNGPHGNAGLYDGVFLDGLIGSGTTLKSFFEEQILGNVDLLITGHDHSLQDHGEVRGTQILVSGAGASTTDLDGLNPTLFQASELGFVFLEITSTTLSISFITVSEGGEGPTASWQIAHEREVVRTP